MYPVTQMRSLGVICGLSPLTLFIKRVPKLWGVYIVHLFSVCPLLPISASPGRDLAMVSYLGQCFHGLNRLSYLNLPPAHQS